MNKSQSNKNHHHHHHQQQQQQQTSGAAATSLPFGIDHILSSASPIKQAAAVQQAMAAIDHQHHSHLSRQQINQQQQHQQQQMAAMQLMLNSATHLPSVPVSNGQQDLINASSLNEQLALLAAASQQQQQQQQHHLLNPTALATAAQAQQHLQWQYQQQQLMAAATAAAAAAAASHQQQPTNPMAGALNPLSALGSLNSLAGQTQANLGGLQSGAGNASGTSPATNHLLSCFMASMLLQQQQQQAQQQPSQLHHPPLEHQRQAHNFLLSNQTPPFSQPSQLDGPRLDNFNIFNPLVSGTDQRRSPASSNASTNSPVKQFFSDKSSPSLYEQQQKQQFSRASNSNHSSVGINSASSSSLKSADEKRFGDQDEQSRNTSKLNKTKAVSQNNRTSQKNASSSSSLIGITNATSLAGINNTKNSINTISCSNNNADATDADDECGTALSSLSNFVTKSLAPILDEFNNNVQRRQRATLDQRANMTTNYQQRTMSKNHSISSGSESSMIADDETNGNSTNKDHDNKSVSSTRSGGHNILDAVASALKNSTANSADANNDTKIINTAIARAPPELVQKQPAWVFCTRYSDRPSSGPRTRRAKSKDKKPKDAKLSADEKRPRTAFTSEQLEKLRREFQANSYLDEKRRKSLADRLCLNENQIKIWFQNKRAKMKKQSNQPNPLRGLLVAGGLYNHSTATSDCSESYANGHADDVGNRAIRDFDLDEPEVVCDDDEADVDDDDQIDATGATNSERLSAICDGVANNPRGQFDENLIDRSRSKKMDHHSVENLLKDQLHDKQIVATSVSHGQTKADLEPTKKRPANSTDDQETDDSNGPLSDNPSAANSLKRPKLDRSNFNHIQMSAGSTTLSRNHDREGLDNDLHNDESVISVN